MILNDIQINYCFSMKTITDKPMTVSEESDTDEEEEEVQPGDIVWRLLGRHWYPGKVCNLTNVPNNIKHKFQTSSIK